MKVANPLPLVITTLKFTTLVYCHCTKSFFDSLFQQDCEYDSLSLSSKMGSGEVRKHGLFCGSRLPPVITSEGNSLRLEFNSDNSVQKSGFAAIFFTG